MTGWSGWLVALVTFAAVAPTLRWFEFSNGIEQLYTATILELGRGGPWLVPQLIGAPRIAKPPLPAWVGGLSLSGQTMQGVGSPDPAVRERAFLRLGWEVRWPALLAGCLMIVATCDLGRTVGGRRAGLAAAVIAATSLLFLRFARLATADVYLGCFVAIANALLARAALNRQFWLGCIGGGAAVGLAFMCKGPVAILQTAIPYAIWAILLRQKKVKRASIENPAAVSKPNRLPRLAIVLGVIAFLAIALPWPILVLKHLPSAIKLWQREVTREGATDHEYAPVWAYLSLLPNLLPWLPLVLLGLATLFRGRTDNAAGALTGEATATAGPVENGQAGALAPASAGEGTGGTFLRTRLSNLRRHRGYFLAFLLLVVPILVMSVFRDKSERYLVPILPAAAVIGARGWIAVVAGVGRPGRAEKGVRSSDSGAGVPPAGSRDGCTTKPLRRASSWTGWISAIQLGIVGVMLIAMPVAGMFRSALKRADGHAWFGPELGVPALIIALLLIAAMFRMLRRRRLASAFGIAFVGMLGVNALLIWGYKDDRGGRSEMKPMADKILAHWPNPVVVYCDESKPIPPDLLVYLNRVVRTWSPARAKGLPAKMDHPEVVPDVLVMLQRERAPEPAIPGWHGFTKTPYKARFWHALERDSRFQATQPSGTSSR